MGLFPPGVLFPNDRLRNVEAAASTLWRCSVGFVMQSDIGSTNAGEQVTLRLLAEDDLTLLHEWLNKPHIVEWWQGERPTLNEVRQHYRPRIVSPEKVTPFIGLLDGKPFAYAQSYVAMGALDGWWEEETDPGVRGIDQSIGYPQLMGRGLGTRLVEALVDLLFRDPRVTKVQTDPAPENLRAIRCYEKAGFRKVKAIVTPHGPAIYMIRERGQASRAFGVA